MCCAFSESPAAALRPNSDATPAQGRRRDPAKVALSASVFWGLMAIAIVGGLIVGTLLRLAFVPAVRATGLRCSPIGQPCEAGSRGRDKEVTRLDCLDGRVAEHITPKQGRNRLARRDPPGQP